MPEYNFTVDAALLQELGERLIGQPHIALAELIKNAYDADARNCRVTFGDDFIRVTDDGSGMTASEFRDYWMRVGSTHKVEQAVSEEFERPLTGAKGLGRLAVQFLADRLTIRTTARGQRRTLEANLNWTSVMRRRDLQSVIVRTEYITEVPTYPANSPHGFQVIMRGLKQEWTTAQLENLGREVWSLRSPFRKFGRRSARGSGDDFDILVQSDVIEDARASFDALQEQVLNDWKARIIGKLTNGREGEPAQITVEFRAG